MGLANISDRGGGWGLTYADEGPKVQHGGGGGRSVESWWRPAVAEAGARSPRRGQRRLGWGRPAHGEDGGKMRQSTVSTGSGQLVRNGGRCRGAQNPAG